MTGRKPSGASWESWIEKAIRQGQQEGVFDDLAGKGQRIADIDRDGHDDDWWLKRKLAAEQLSYLPPTLAVKKELADTRERIARASSEDQVRALVSEINSRIRQVNSRATSGPPSTVYALDIDHVLRGWRERRTNEH